MLRAFSSSPDPLNDSPTFQSPVRPRRSSTARYSLPLQRSSPTKRTFQLDLGNPLSPQKIKVTVEAGSDTENTNSQFGDNGRSASPWSIAEPLNRQRGRTTTTTVPLRGLSDSEGENLLATPKRGKGRPRKSGTPIPAKQPRNSTTPTHKSRRSRKSIGEQVYGDSEDDADFRLGRGLDVKRGKGRQRKSTSAMQSESLENSLPGTANRIGRARRKTLAPDEVVILEDRESAGVMDHDGAPPTDLSGALSTMDYNAAYPPSAHSTIRSTTSASGGEEPDITIARFDPGNETPRQAGWSSPRMVDSSRASNPTRPSSSYPSPSSSLEKPRGHQREDVATSPLLSGRYESADIHDGGEDDDEEVEDRPDEVPEFDTILESEEFSMISVDSVPSLRQHFTSPPDGGIAEPVGNPNLSMAQTAEAGKNKSLPSVSGSVVGEATSIWKPQNRSLLSIQNTNMDDSFSSIPSEILEAATPARKSVVSNLLGTKNLYAEDSFSSIAPEILDAATPGRNLPKATAPETTLPQGDSYDDSFSAIPSAILDAATPAPLRHTLFKPGHTSQTGVAPERLSATGSIQSASSALRGGQGPVIARLLTPEESPSPSDISIPQKTAPSSKLRNVASVMNSVEQMHDDESYMSSQMKSSPPVIATRRQAYPTRPEQHSQLHTGETQTPAIIFSSPSLPPPIQIAKEHPLLGSRTEDGQKPALSPTVRAGRMLQDILVPSSPRGRSESLGSPFKSPVMERKSSTAANGTNPSPQERQVEPLSRPNTAGSLFPRLSQDSQFNNSARYDDPFVNSVSARSETQVYSPELPGRLPLSDPRLASTRSEGNSLQDDDEMSWQVEEVVSLNQDPTPAMNYLNSAAKAGVRSSDSASIAASHTDMWEQKWAAERAAVSREIENADTSKVIVIDSEAGDHNSQVGNDEEDFDLLLETLNSPFPTVQQQPNRDSVDQPRQPRSLSSWRMNNKRSAHSDELSHLSSPIQGWVPSTRPVKDLSASSGAQSFNFNPRVLERGNQDIFAMLASSPNKNPPARSKKSLDNNSPSTESRPSKRSTMEVNSVTNSNEPPHQFKTIPQKLNFNPRVRDPESSFASSPVRQPTYGIFGVQPGKERPSKPAASSIASAPRPLENSPQIGTDTLPIPGDQGSPMQLSSASTGYDSASSPINEEEENLAINRTKEWTESVRLASAQMQGFSSPAKSCLRSPLKTPRAGSGSRGSTSSVKTVAFVSSSPVPPSPTQEPLSGTTWSRDHWVLLDEIVEDWKPENQIEEQVRRRNSTRVVSSLLGRTVSSGEHSMMLEQWHLEAVDEFRGEVPGWQEKTIALRVFSLIAGEKIRAEKGLPPRSRGG
jgi:serine/arginine repetitive matrix protein 2